MEMPMLAIKQSKATRSMLVENSDKEADVAPKSEADSGKGTSFSTSEAEADGKFPWPLKLKGIARVKPTHLSLIPYVMH